MYGEKELDPVDVIHYCNDTHSSTSCLFVAYYTNAFDRLLYRIKYICQSGRGQNITTIVPTRVLCSRLVK